MRITVIFVLFLLLLAGSCTSQKPSPDELREKTAQATSDFKRNAKALAEGVKEGWSRDRPLDLNEASKEQLLNLPGISSDEAARIIAERPYNNASDLVSRRVISEQQYDKIIDQVTAKN